MSSDIPRVALALCALLLLGAAPGEQPWTGEEIKALRSLRLADLGPPPPDPTNRYADDPAAADFGRLLFNDARLSSNGKVSCASCHDPARGFTDSEPLAKGVATGNRRTMPIVPALYSPWQFWDGRADSLWAQALGPLENPAEHGSSRTEVARLVATHYAQRYRAVFGPLPGEVTAGGLPDRAAPAGAGLERAWQSMTGAQRDAVTRVFVHAGKAIAAFERSQRVAPARFDKYLASLLDGGPAAPLTADERGGLRLFIGKAQCSRCHNGPLLTNHGFANTGVPARPGLPADRGRIDGIRLARADPFNCRGPFNDAAERFCDELDFAVAEAPELNRAYKVPSLRGAALRPPFMHAGQFATLEDVVDHYDRAPAAPAGRSELEPLGLTALERRQLVAFLRSLDPEPQAPSGASRAAVNGGRTRRSSR